MAMFYTSIENGKEGVNAFNEKWPAVVREQASASPPLFLWDV